MRAWTAIVCVLSLLITGASHAAHTPSASQTALLNPTALLKSASRGKNYSPLASGEILLCKPLARLGKTGWLLECASTIGETGYQKDDETNLYYAQQRYYDSFTGRFLREDPFEGDKNTPPSLHRYLYAYSNPTIYIDPDGQIGFLTTLRDQFNRTDDILRNKAVNSTGFVNAGFNALRGFNSFASAGPRLLNVASDATASVIDVDAFEGVRAQGRRNYGDAVGPVVDGLRSPIQTGSRLRAAASNTLSRTLSGEKGAASDLFVFSADLLAGAGAGKLRNLGKVEAPSTNTRPQANQGIGAPDGQVVVESAQEAGAAARRIDNSSSPAFDVESSSRTVSVDSSAKSKLGGAPSSSRHAEFSNDLDAIDDVVQRLGQRALRESGGDWRKSEKLFESYLQAVESRLSNSASRYGVEIQPATLPGQGRVPAYIYHHYGGPKSPLVPGPDGLPRLFAYTGSKRLDAGIVDLSLPTDGGFSPVVSGFDITTSMTKPSIIETYQQAFGIDRIYDIRLDN